METLKADVLELLSGSGFYSQQNSGAYVWYAGYTTDYTFSAQYPVGSIPGNTSGGGGAFFIYDKNGKIIGAS